MALQPSNDGPINSRMYFPAAIALLVVACEVLDAAAGGRLGAALRNAAGGTRLGSLMLRLSMLGTSAAMLLALGGAAYATGHATSIRIDPDRAPDHDLHGMVDSLLIDHLRDDPPDGRLYSNRSAAIFWLTDIQPLGRLPRRLAEPLPDSECLDFLKSSNDGRDKLADGIVYVAWISERAPNDPWTYCDMPGIAQRSALVEPVTEFADGAIYRFDPGDG